MNERPSIDRHRRSLLALPLACGALTVNAAALARLTPPPEVTNEVPGARLLGSGRLTYYLFHVYDARLWAGPGFDVARFDQSLLALELDYARGCSGDASCRSLH